MKKLWLVIIGIVLFSGCDIANTPTSKVEDFLGKYQRLDSDISLSYVQLSDDENISNEYRESYQELIEKQYKSLSYEIKDEKIDGESAVVTAQIKVYDYGEVIEQYNKNSYNTDEYHKLVIKALNEQKDKVTYTIEFELNMNEKDEWKVVGLNLDDKRKLLGIN